jgi:N-acetylmuramoyl-L-alanine amidase
MPFRWTGPRPARHYARVSFVLALLACWLGGTPSWAATIERVEIRHDRIIIRFDQSVADASSFVLASPQRIAVDVGGASPGAPIDGKGLVAAVRQAPHGNDGTRIVFDLARPAIVTEGVFGPDGRELTLELRTVDDASFARAAAERRLRFLPPFNLGAVIPERKYEVSVPIPPPSRTLALPRW